MYITISKRVIKAANEVNETMSEICEKELGLKNLYPEIKPKNVSSKFVSIEVTASEVKINIHDDLVVDCIQFAKKIIVRFTPVISVFRSLCSVLKNFCGEAAEIIKELNDKYKFDDVVVTEPTVDKE